MGAILELDERNRFNIRVTTVTGIPIPCANRGATNAKPSCFKNIWRTTTDSCFPACRVVHAGMPTLSTLGIATGGREKQILLALSGSPIEKGFDELVSAEDLPFSKSHPAIYLHTLDRPNEIPPPSEAPLVPAQRLVIEDSLAGIGRP
jgi:hypothetical protein